MSGKTRQSVACEILQRLDRMFRDRDESNFRLFRELKTCLGRQRFRSYEELQGSEEIYLNTLGANFYEEIKELNLISSVKIFVIIIPIEILGFLETQFLVKLTELKKYAIIEMIF
ncbi:hypothetical protein AVEN_181798-1 [Araneus ventricosus]|uniref:Uncharacterized protein n=1 Tax=Araneus ventricosus TaxID=182803 RepID=A0A4Y2STU4_ARAVE|nr:hypothetical protein AVEN_161478-1 [Araneus ventricosus]GBN92282.1 hypothetical protein AVEN_181798-1 [Araneus ventricosus]